MAKSMMTARIEDGILERLKALATQKGCSVASIIDAALSQYLARHLPVQPEAETAPPENEDDTMCQCGHARRFHTNRKVSAGAGCSQGICNCRRFVIDDSQSKVHWPSPWPSK